MKTRTHSQIFSVFATAILLIAGGCGYQVGSSSLMHPQIKSIAIAAVTNETLAPNVAAEMRNMLAEQFATDGSLKLKSLEEADCILYCVVTKVETTSFSEDAEDNEMIYRPAEWSVSVTAKFSVIIPGRAKPLLSEREASGNARYNVYTDHDITKRRGIKMACFQAAEEIVEYTTEAW